MARACDASCSSSNLGVLGVQPLRVGGRFAFGRCSALGGETVAGSEKRGGGSATLDASIMGVSPDSTSDISSVETWSAPP
eukprot:scaffold43095_cov27-Tisochrysis_lutea.AAC.1